MGTRGGQSRRRLSAGHGLHGSRVAAVRADTGRVTRPRHQTRRPVVAGFIPDARRRRAGPVQGIGDAHDRGQRAAHPGTSRATGPRLLPAPPRPAAPQGTVIVVLAHAEPVPRPIITVIPPFSFPPLFFLFFCFFFLFFLLSSRQRVYMYYT